LQAAHEAGILHRDVKPSNILIDEADGAIRAKLCDFGVGQVVSQETFTHVTRLGFTDTASTSTASGPGTHLYMAPELFAGKPAAVASDIYALGVVLYQFVTGDWSKPLTMDWIKYVEDPLLRDDLVKCFAGDPSDRFQNAGQLANTLQSMGSRRELEKAKESQAQAILKRAYLFTLLRKGFVGTIAAALLVSIFLLGRDALAGRYGAMEIRSFPEGAEIWYKGEMLGVTPFAVPQSPPGEFDLTLKLTNHQIVETKVVVAKRERARHLVFMPTNFQGMAFTTNVQPQINTNAANTVQIKAASEKVATVVTVEGKVQIRRMGSNAWEDARVGTTLSAGDTLRTAESSRASIRSADYGTMRISALSEFELSAPNKAELKKGSLFFLNRDSTNRVPVEFRGPTVSGSIRG
jgi:hypothetical protein